MASGILPFRPVLRDFIRNLWVLRLFFFILMVVLLTSSLGLAFAERSQLASSGTFLSAWAHAVSVTLSGFGQTYVPVTIVGRAAQVLNVFVSRLLLGILLWVIQQSLSEHTLKKSKYILFPTDEDL